MAATLEEIACYVKGMHPILKRILINGLLTAGMLALIGVGYAELAGIWLVSKTPSRGAFEAPIAAGPAEEPLAASLKYRIPAMMALWGFLFVAAGEGVLHLWKRRRPAPVPSPPADLPPDPAEVLLEQIMAKVDAARSTPSEPAPSPSPVPSENSPVA